MVTIVERWLEGSPARHEAGIACMTLGRRYRLFWTIAQRWVAPGDRVLDLDCGTGTFAVESALKGALVTALGRSPDAVAAARRHARACGLDGVIRLIEGSAAHPGELFGGEQFDVIAATFVLSELTPAERSDLLGQIECLLAPGGRFIVADEIVPRKLHRRALAAGLRWPLLALSGLITGHLSHPLKGFEASLLAAGWTLRSRRTLLAGTIGVLVAERS